jgi:hypothetical protein
MTLLIIRYIIRDLHNHMDCIVDLDDGITSLEFLHIIKVV